MVTTLKLNAVQVLAIAGFGLALGVWLKKKVPLLDWLNISASVVGGLVYALVLLAVRDRYLNVEMDLVLRDILMVAFFQCGDERESAPDSRGREAGIDLFRVGHFRCVL